MTRDGRDSDRLSRLEKMARRRNRLGPVLVEPELENQIDIGMEGEEGRIERRALRVRHVAPEIGGVHRIVVLAFELTVAADRRFLRIAAEFLPIRVIDKRGNRGRTGDLLEELFFLCGQ